MLILATTTEQVENLLATARMIEQTAKDKTFAEQLDDYELVLALRKTARLSLEAMDFGLSVW